jgi:plastocyanin
MIKVLKVLKYSYAFSVTFVFVLAFSIFTASMLSQSNQNPQSYAQVVPIAEIVFDGESFSPQNITVQQGNTVRWTNVHTSEYTQIASDPHPIHTDDPFLNVGLVEPNGGVVTVIVSQIGDFSYHDHLHPQATGSITVVGQPVATSTQAPTQTPSPIPQSTITQAPSPTITRISTSTPTLEVTPEVLVENPEIYETTMIGSEEENEEIGEPLESHSTFSIQPYVIGAIIITIILFVIGYVLYRKEQEKNLSPSQESQDSV